MKLIRSSLSHHFFCCFITQKFIIQHHSFCCFISLQQLASERSELTSADRVKLTGPDWLLIGIKMGFFHKSNGIYLEFITNQKGGQSLWKMALCTGVAACPARITTDYQALFIPLFFLSLDYQALYFIKICWKLIL